MSQPAPSKNTIPVSITPPHTVSAPQPGQNYYAVLSGKTGHEIARCDTADSAAKEKTRLDKLG